MKICSQCKKELSEEMFNKGKGGKAGLRSNCKRCEKQYYQNNKQAIATREKQHYQNNKEKAKQHYQENKEKIKQYQQENREVIEAREKLYKQNNKEIIAAQRKKYRQEHKEECCKHTHTRRAKEYLLSSTLTVQQWNHIKQQFDNKCAYCGKELTLVQDHFLALSKGGEYSHNNIIPSCKFCNCSKHNSDFFVWYIKYKHYSKKREKKILDFLNYKNKVQQLMFM